MCGVAGMWGETDLDRIRDLMKVQKHRGPDGEGLREIEGRGALGHVRLSIMDPEHGQQPVENEDQTFTLIANGMIYNHPRLRSRLQGTHRFRSSSDSETVMHLFEEQRQDTPLQLDGAFAFGVAHDQGLFLARDPVGIKPLYYGLDRSQAGHPTLTFASELKAISRWVDEVHEFPAGTLYDSRQGFRSYYQVPRRDPVEDTLEVHLQRVRQVVERAVEKRLLSDVPLGAFLSGGLDSSIIAALAIRKLGSLHTFAVGVDGSRDLAAARRVANHIGSTHHEYAFSLQEVREALPEIVYYLESFDQDLVRSAIPCHFCSRLASERVKVILTGEGADELFAGYGYYKEITEAATLHEEMRRSVEGLHNVNLQRVDRMTMRHGIEGRVPFLDTELIDLAQTIPPHWKLHRARNGRRVEKWILRKAFEDLLPRDIVWRDKEQFDEGSGTVEMLDQLITDVVDTTDWQSYQRMHARDRLRSAEECHYHRILVASLERPDPVLRNVGRWTGGQF